MIDKPESRDVILKQISGRYPNLNSQPGAREACIVLSGKFPIVVSGREVDRFFVKIEIPDEFPKAWPRVWETQGRIPLTLKRHANPKDGTLCVLLPDEAFLKYPPAMTVLEYLDGPLRTYLVGQMCVEKGEPWPWGEHNHGAEGLIDFYRELLGIRDPRVIGLMLLTVYEGRYKGHWWCPCGSRKIIRKCHGPEMRTVGERIPLPYLENTLRSITEMLKRSVDAAPKTEDGVT